MWSSLRRRKSFCRLAHKTKGSMNSKRRSDLGSPFLFFELPLIAAGGIANDQFGMEFLGDGCPVPIFVAGFDGLYNDTDGGAAHSFQRLADGSERRSGERGNRNIIKTGDGALFRNADTCLGESTHGPKRGEVVESQNRGEFFLLL